MGVGKKYYSRQRIAHAFRFDVQIKYLCVSIQNKLRYFLEFSYDGSAFHGWQIQPNAFSVQEALEKALSTLLRTTISVVGAGRTDTGVHARMMVAHFDADLPEGLQDNLVHQLNRYLKVPILIHALRPVRADAHARFDAISRTYQYHIGMRKDPFKKGFFYHITTPLDVSKMRVAAKHLQKFEDFQCFAKAHSDVTHYRCAIYKTHWEELPHELVFTIQANRFLRNMVRSIVGTLVLIGQDKISIDDLTNILESKDRGQAGYSVPGEGLFLTHIEYPESVYLHHVNNQR